MKYFSLLFIVLIGGMPMAASGHPGNTAADGCHYCRTNCDKWGVPWNERHCHNGTRTPTTPVTTPTKPKKPVVTTPKKTTVAVCTEKSLLAEYKSRKAKGERMTNLTEKTWWKKCPKKVRDKVYDTLF